MLTIINSVKKNIKWVVYIVLAAIGVLLVVTGMQSKRDGGKLISGDAAQSVLGEKVFADHVGGGGDGVVFSSGDDDDDGGDGGDGE